MGELLKHQITGLDVQSEGRRFKRYANEAAVTLAFRGDRVTGSLVNISISGILGAFDSGALLPRVGEKVFISVETGGSADLVTVEGSVVRVQVPEEAATQNTTEVAVDFFNASPAVKKEIKALIGFLGAATRYKT